MSKVTIKMFDGAYLSAGSVDGPKNVLNPEDPDHIVDIPDSGSDEPGEGRVVATGIDDEGDSYRNHQPKHLLPYNAVTKFYKVIFLNGPGVAHLNPKGGTTLLGWTNPGYLKRSLPNSSNKSKIFFTEFPTGSSPESIWNNIVAAGNRVRGRGQSHYLLVTTNTHASTGAISISQQLGGFWHHDDDNGNSVETASWVVQRSQSKLNDSVIGDLPDLVSVSSFLAIGCDSAQDVDPQDPHKTNGVTNDISMAMAFSKGANNAVGFSTYTYPAYGQLWYNCYYRYGTLAENSGSAQTALTAVTDVYAIKLSVFYPSVTLEDTGYNNWVAAYLSEPLLK